MKKRYRVTLTVDEREQLEALTRKGRCDVRRLRRARVLLLADQGEHGPGWRDATVAGATGCGVRTVERLRQRCVEQGLEAALEAKPADRVYQRKFDGRGEAQLVALACSAPPDGRAKWTLRLLADRAVALGIVEDAEGVSYETVRRTLQKTS